MARFIGLPDLIRLKRQADRPQDRLDIEQLQKCADEAPDEA